MGALYKGKLIDDWLARETETGEFMREESLFRHNISAQGDFKPEAGRYRLYIAHACPWAHRTLIFRKLKQLENFIAVTYVEPEMLDQGWQFAEGEEFDCLHQIYTLADPDVTTQITVPLLWDQQQKTIVNNESSEIIRIFNSAFNHLTGNHDDYYPESLREAIDDINALVYENVNNGVYRCGFATDQKAYEVAFDLLFETLEQLEKRLANQRYLVGAQLTEADWRLFTTLLRFDLVYYGHFKCNLKSLGAYLNLSGFMRELYQYPGIKETVDFEKIKRHYYYSHISINPTQIVPKGPLLDFDQPHCRAQG